MNIDPNVVLPLGSSVLSFVFAAFLFDQWRERRRPYQLIWALGMLWYALSAGTEFLGGFAGWSEPPYRAWYLIGAARGAGGGGGVAGGLRRLERAPVPRLVPDRRRLGRGVAGPGYGLPAGQDALRLRLRVLARPGRPLHLPHLAQVRLPRQRCRTLPLRGRGARDGGRHRGARGPRERRLGAPRRSGDHRWHDRLGGHGADGGPGGTGLGGGPRHAHPHGRPLPWLPAAAHAVLQYHRGVLPDARRALQRLRLHAQTARRPLLAGRPTWARPDRHARGRRGGRSRQLRRLAPT